MNSQTLLADKEQRKAFLEGLKRYKMRGVSIFIDGEESSEEDWNKIFEVKEDGFFYMGDYVGADTGHLTEIRFDKVYYK